MVIKVHFKYFIEYDHNGKIRTLFIKLPRMTGCAEHFKDGNKTRPLRVIEKNC